MVLVNCYRPPSCCPRNFSNAMVALSHLLDSLPIPTPDIILTGDFNFPFLKWPEGILTGSTLADKSQAELLLDRTNSAFLIQVITDPTRGNNILDLLFTNNSDAVNSIAAEKTIFSDHRLLRIHTNYKISTLPPEVTRPIEKTPFSSLNFFSSEVNWDLINAHLRDTDWEAVLQDGDPEIMVDSLLTTILRACEGNVPMKRRQGSRRSDIPRERKILMRRRATLNQRMLKTSNDCQKSSLQAKISAVEKEIRESHEKQRDWEENQAVKNIKVNPKFFFKYCKKFSKTHARVGPLKAENGEMSRNPQETCHILSQQYTSLLTATNYKDHTQPQ